MLATHAAVVFLDPQRLQEVREEKTCFAPGCEPLTALGTSPRGCTPCLPTPCSTLVCSPMNKLPVIVFPKRGALPKPWQLI